MRRRNEVKKEKEGTKGNRKMLTKKDGAEGY